MRFKKAGLPLSEGDPIVVVVPNIGDPDSVAYFRGGNYTIAPGSPGYRAPPAVFQSLTDFMSHQNGVTERSNGAGYVYFVDNLANLTTLSQNMRDNVQFARIGAATAARFVVPFEPPYLTFLLFTSVNGPPQVYAGFNVI